MEIIVQRFFHGTDSTIGFLRVIDHGITLFTMEDERRDEKVRGETRIPAGKYSVDFRRDITPLTKKYRDKYDWFIWHLQIQNVKNFNSVYIHVGNFQSNTHGCLLVGNTALLPRAHGLKEGEESMIGDSRNAFKQLYMKCKSAIDSDEPITLTIINR